MHDLHTNLQVMIETMESAFVWNFTNTYYVQETMIYDYEGFKNDIKSRMIELEVVQRMGKMQVHKHRKNVRFF